MDSEWNFYLPNIDLAEPEYAVRSLLSAADAGEASAFRHLTRIVEFCSRPDNEPYNGEEYRALFDAQYADGEISAELHEHFMEMVGFCATVSPLLPARDWYLLGRDAGDPVLLLMNDPEPMQVIRFDGQLDPDPTTRAAVIAAANTLDPIVLRTISMWSLGEDGLSNDEDGIRFRAWDHLICRVDAACDEALAQAILTRDLFAYERDEILAEAYALEALVRAGRLTLENLETSARGER